MSDTQERNRETLEDSLLFAVQEISEAAFERFTSGELTQEELQEVYNLLQRWTVESEKALQMLHK